MNYYQALLKYGWNLLVSSLDDLWAPNCSSVVNGQAVTMLWLRQLIAYQFCCHLSVKIGDEDDGKLLYLALLKGSDAVNLNAWKLLALIYEKHHLCHGLTHVIDVHARQAIAKLLDD